MIKRFFYTALMFGGALFWFFVAVHFASGERVIRYDCSIAEISPDYPLQVKEDCRKLKTVHI
jgi:hypothetical protein